MRAFVYVLRRGKNQDLVGDASLLAVRDYVYAHLHCTAQHLINRREPFFEPCGRTGAVSRAGPGDFYVDLPCGPQLAAGTSATLILGHFASYRSGDDLAIRLLPLG